MTRRLDPTIAAQLGDALAGQRLSPARARRLANDLRAIGDGFPTPTAGPDRALTRDLLAAAETLETQAAARARS